MMSLALPCQLHDRAKDFKITLRKLAEAYNLHGKRCHNDYYIAQV